MRARCVPRPFRRTAGSSTTATASRCAVSTPGRCGVDRPLQASGGEAGPRAPGAAPGDGCGTPGCVSSARTGKSRSSTSNAACPGAPRSGSGNCASRGLEYEREYRRYYPAGETAAAYRRHDQHRRCRARGHRAVVRPGAARQARQQARIEGQARQHHSRPGIRVCPAHGAGTWRSASTCACSTPPTGNSRTRWRGMVPGRVRW